MSVVERTKVYILQYPSDEKIIQYTSEKYEFSFEVYENAHPNQMVNIQFLKDGIQHSITIVTHNGKEYAIPMKCSLENARHIWKDLIRWNYVHVNP